MTVLAQEPVGNVNLGGTVFREEVRGLWNAVPFFAEPGGQYDYFD